MELFVNYKIIDRRNCEIDISKVIIATDKIMNILDSEFVKFSQSNKKISLLQKKMLVEQFKKIRENVRTKLFEAILYNLGKHKKYYSSLSLISKHIGSKEDVFGYAFSENVKFVNSKIFKKFSKLCNIQIYGSAFDNSYSIFLDKKDGIYQIKDEENIL